MVWAQVTERHHGKIWIVFRIGIECEEEGEDVHRLRGGDQIEGGSGLADVWSRSQEMRRKAGEGPTVGEP